jgi:hypothetical protein
MKEQIELSNKFKKWLLDNSGVENKFTGYQAYINIDLPEVIDWIKSNFPDVFEQEETESVKFDILHNTYYPNLTEQVNKKLKAGWKLAGNLVVTSHIGREIEDYKEIIENYYQPMIKET